MNRKAALSLSATLVLATTTFAAPAQADAEAAEALMKKNECFKCHAIDKFKKGPPFKRVAARLKTKPDGVAMIVEHITSGPMIQMDEVDQRHKIIDTMDPVELRNIAQWILSL